MTRRLAPEKQLEVDRLGRVLAVIATWADPLTGLPPEGETFSKAVARTCEARDLPGLRMMLNDLVPITEAATVAQRKDLDRALRENVGVTLASLMERQRAQIERLVKRGKLTSEQQYYLVREHLDLIADDPEQAASLPTLDAMVEAYEISAAKRGRR
jgi:hypothetical protein